MQFLGVTGLSFIFELVDFRENEKDFGTPEDCDTAKTDFGVSEVVIGCGGVSCLLNFPSVSKVVVKAEQAVGVENSDDNMLLSKSV